MNNNEQRDELAEVIAYEADKHHGFADSNLPPAQQDRELADAILAAGYRKPRTITTSAELDALPAGAVILGRDGVACQKEEIPGLWDSAGELISTDFVALPATVIHEPTTEATQ